MALTALFSRLTASILAFFTAIFSVFVPAPKVDYTPLEGRAYSDTVPEIAPDLSKHLTVTVKDEGQDIYTPSRGADFGYRYGPTIFVNADGSFDAWFAAPGAKGQWDWISYKHSPDGGKSWTDEIEVLQPTPGSEDFYSCCDPGVVKIGDYYYLGYTSTTDVRGVDNNVFVARSTLPQGPYEKWNGSGWGGVPVPIVVFDEDFNDWGAGEPSFVLKGDTLFIYYTWRSRTSDGAAINETRVAIANAADENWPATIEKKGTAIHYKDSGCDSADVKFVDDFGKFIAISTSDRLGANSFVSIYESNDGLTFSKACDLKTNIAYYCHNSGLSSRPNGHIMRSDGNYLAYAYGPNWGFWATRLHSIEIGLADAADFSDAPNPNAKRDVTLIDPHKTVLGITVSEHDIKLSSSQCSYPVSIYAVDGDFNLKKILCGVSFSGYDEDVIKINGKRIKPLAKGSTYVTASYCGFDTLFLVTVE